jgi:hypothetical protein
MNVSGENEAKKGKGKTEAGQSKSWSLHWLE